MCISQKKTCSLLSGCWCVQYFQSNQVIELDLGSATALVNSKSPLAATNWEAPEISLGSRVLLLAFKSWVISVSFISSYLLCESLVSSFFPPVLLLALCILGVLRLLSFPVLTSGQPLHYTGSKFKVSWRNFFFFFWFFDLFMNLLQSGTSLDKASECASEGFPSALLCSLHCLTLGEGPANSKGKSLSEFLPCPAFGILGSVHLEKCLGKELASRCRLTPWLLTILIHRTSPHVVTASL